MSEIKYPAVSVQLTGEDGNAFFILGKVMQALKKGGASAADVEQFKAEAMSGDYDKLLQTCMKWVNVA